MGRTKGSFVLAVLVVAGCTIVDANPNTGPVGGSSGTSPGGTSSSAGAGAAPNAGKGALAGSSAGGDGGSGTSSDAGAGAGGDEPAAGGTGGADASGGAGGEAGTGGDDGCAPACSATQTCVAGSCKDQECPPAASFCSDAQLRTCAADGLSSTAGETCGSLKYCDANTSTCKTASYGMCPQLYLGSGRFGAPPRPATEANDALWMSSYEVKVGAQVFGQLRVHNLGTDNSPSTHVELFVSDSDGYPTAANRLIFETNVVVPGAANGGSPGEWAQNYSYSFPTVGRHVLLARVENNSPPAGAGCSSQGYDVSHPTTDPLTAVHYIHVVE